MKHIATVFALVLGIQQAFANRIDKLHTTEEVLDFLTEHVNKDWQGYAIPQENPNDTSEFRKGRFFKVDLDRNVFDYWKAVEVKKIVVKNMHPIPVNESIEEIFIVTSGCYGACPIFNMDIKNDRTAVYDAIKFNDTVGKYKAKIDSTSFEKVIDTINYIKFYSLQDYYGIDTADNQTVTLIVKFNDGQIKKIVDYGASGTLGLMSLYKQLFALRSTQQWQVFQ